MAEDYYKTLGVDRQASADAIRKAYKKLAREYHPDVKPGDKQAETKFKEIQDAYAVVGNEDERAKYDRFGHAYKQSGGNPFAGAGGGGGGFGFDLNDIFGDVGGGGFGGFGSGPRQRRARPAKGQDLTSTIQVPFQVAAEGGKYELTVNRGDKAERLTITIPPGVNTGSKIRLAGQGYPGQHSGPSGDLIVTVNAAPHPYFRRDRDNLLIDVPITPPEAALGTRIDIPTLTEGSVVLTIPPETSSGTKLRLKGKGVPNQKTKTRGDQYVVIKIEIPKGLCEDTKKLYEQLQAESSESPRDGLW
jgi:curved DNA-binding protein